MNPDALLGRVRKLLAMAEAEGLPEAARENYNAKAAELIAQYGIDRALIEDAAPAGAVAGDVVMGIDAPYARDKISLLASVADPLGCRLVHRTMPAPAGAGTATVHTAHLFGMAGDIERVQMLYTSLLVQQAHGLAAASPPVWEDPRAFRRSWMAGFSVAVRDRLALAEETARRRAESAGRAAGVGAAGERRSVAVVLAGREGLVEAHLARVYPRLRATRARQLSGSGGRDGYQAGQRADLGEGRRMPGRQRARREIG
ncbi:Protein of unknown function (DUF2786) [Frankia sp. EI5c]|uniref:DUF2786 domain-containing protein n=1 Tax=Frankia sp. EI5c TaxID=683316 RepID=UPI0007C3E956|nr:DUF2786 domain-containing protein [Frankia sp. EI5c]OAA20889.1 Protein of unknown function (DUF2786) [Frankia sp. EI5c]OAA22057.1 Protein of unknown function (DUF2786) [Frankia sp. EI5c]